jgi:DNA-binding MarR family transcriptional regulator
VSEHDTSTWSELDPVLTAPKRLAAMALLSRAGSADFGYLRGYLQLSDSDLSKQMAALQAADYVSVAKSGRGRGATTSFAITKTGRTAYDAHRATLQGMLGE